MARGERESAQLKMQYAFGQKKKGGEQEYNVSARHKGEGMQQPGVTQCVEKKMWRFPLFSSCLIHPLFLLCLPLHHPAPLHPPLLIWPSPRFKDACGLLAPCLLGGDCGCLGGSRRFSGGRTRGLHPEEALSMQSQFSDTGDIFYRERIKPLRFRPRLCFL